MRKSIVYVVAMIMTFSMCVCFTSCGHSEEKAALEGMWYYVDEEPGVPMTSLKFSGDSVVMTKVDRLGEDAEETVTEGKYTINDEKIDLDFGGDGDFSIKYKMKDGKISLGKRCFSKKQVKKAIQGVWKDFEGVEDGVSSASYVQFDGNKFVYKMTTRALISFSGNTYSFTKSGTYKIGIGQLLLDYGFGNAKSDYWFLYDNGEIFVVSADSGYTMTRVDSMPDTVDAIGF